MSVVEGCLLLCIGLKCQLLQDVCWCVKVLKCQLLKVVCCFIKG